MNGAIDKLLYALRHDLVSNPYNLYMGVFGNRKDMDEFRGVLHRYADGRCGYPEQYEENAQRMLNAIGMNESKSDKNMKKNVVKINENTLRQIVSESVKKVLKEGQMGFSRDADSYGEELRSRELNGLKPQRDELREHSRKILMGIYDDLHTWETYAMDNSNGIDKQAAFDAYMAAMEAIETLGKAFYGDEFWGN